MSRFSAARGIETRRKNVDTLKDNQAKVSSITGKITVGPGPGEGLVDVSFPVWFVDEPNISFGSQLYENQFPTDGSFPTCNAMVQVWETIEPDGIDAGRKFWVGASLLVVTTGIDDQRIYLHYRAEGVAIRNPANRTSDLTADDTV